MSFTRYPHYKDSGVEWLGQLPLHWNTTRVRWLCQIKKRIVGELGYDVLSITQGGIRVKDLESNDGQVSMDYSKYQLVEPGDFAMNHMDLLTGWVDVSRVIGVTSPDYRVFAVRDRSVCDWRYLLYVLQMGYRNKIFYAYGQGSSQLGRWRLPAEQFKDLRFPVPKIDEQMQIASFLDRETEKIEKLAAEQRRLIELLKEKRQAAISRAVTKGLNPNATMKPSGVEWLGEIPAHWEVIRLKYIAKSIIGLTYAPADIVDAGEGVLVLRSSNVQGGQIYLGDNVYVRTTVPPILVTQVGDILVCSRNGSRALIGKNAVIDDRSAGVTFGAFMTVIRSKHSKYIACVLNSPLFEYQSGAFMTSTINQLTAGVLDNLEIPFPPESERSDIAAYIAERTRGLDALAEQSARAIELLEQRRSTLISAAVTGEIDVRGLGESAAA